MFWVNVNLEWVLRFSKRLGTTVRVFLVLTDFWNRGVEEILIASVDGLNGFPAAIAAIFLTCKFSCASCIRFAAHYVTLPKKTRKRSWLN